MFKCLLIFIRIYCIIQLLNIRDKYKMTRRTPQYLSRKMDRLTESILRSWKIRYIFNKNYSKVQSKKLEGLNSVIFSWIFIT